MSRLGRLRGGLVAALLLAAGLVHAGPRPASELRASQDRLGEIRRKLEAAQGRASAARQREVSLLAELEQIDRALVSKRLAVARLDARIAQVESEIERLEGRRGRVAEDLVRQQAALSARLETLARLAMAPAGPGWPPDPEGLRRRLAANDLARVTQDDLARLTRYDETAERLAARQAAVARGRQELVALRRAVDRERAEVAGHADRRRELLREVKDDRTTHERMAAELTEASRRLEALVRSLARRPPPVRRAVARPSVPAAPRGPAVGLERERGHLPWPVEGRVIGEFGPQVNPRFGTETVRPGIDIEAPEGAPIRAVAPATVAYRGWLKGYGNLVILDHGDGFHTLYAHASTVLVDEGETVRAGGVIGRVGETGSVDGPRLHFEVRSQGRAEDPRQWLSGRP